MYESGGEVDPDPPGSPLAEPDLMEPDLMEPDPLEPVALEPGLLELERIAAQGWRGTTEQALGGWLLRAGSGFTGRANSVLPLGASGHPLSESLRIVAEFYAAQGLPAIFQLPEDVPGTPLHQLDTALAGLDWTSYNTTAVMTCPLPEVLAACPPRPDLPPAEFSPEPSAVWLRGYLYRGAALPASAVAVLTRSSEPVFVTQADARGPAAVARGVVTEGWLGVTAVTVDADRRRSGLGRLLMGELARWAGERGAASVYLQVDQANAAATAMYRRLGFRLHHRYHYRRAPGG